MDDLQDIGNFNPQGEIESVNAQGGKEGHNRSIIHGQLGNNNIIYMANDRDRVIRDYVVLTPQAIKSGIVRLEVQAAKFELKPMMFQTVKVR